MEADNAYHVKLDSFEGPLDLLLHLIKENEVDIWDIPISTITSQYLHYIDMMKLLNLDLAGEFLLMAATLIQIKSKMLLPQPDDEDSGEEETDPREELVKRLLEYRKYKEASKELSARDITGRDVFLLGFAEDVEKSPDEGNIDISLFDLLKALSDILKTSPPVTPHNVKLETVSVKEKIDIILDRLDLNEHITFHSLFEKDTSKEHIIATFLAILELAKRKTIRTFQGETFGTINVTKADPSRTIH